MSNQIRKFGLANGVKPKGKHYSLSDLIQESYNISYKAKKINNKKLIMLTESHLSHLKDDPTKIKTLSEDLDVLKGLVKIGKDQKLKDIEEVKTPKKKRRRTSESSMKPMEQVKESWTSSNLHKSKNFKSFRESCKSKVFYKELGKFNKSILSKQPITMTEAINLYKACNSCLTHLTVELEKKPNFLKAYRECTNALSKDVTKLLESIQENKLPSKSLLENFVRFTNLLLECDTPDKLDDEIYEDSEITVLDDRDVINEDVDTVDSEEASIDLTPEEISILQNILNKISNIDEDQDIDLVDDETVVEEPSGLEDELEEDEDLDPEDSEDLEEDEDIEDDSEYDFETDIEDDEIEESDDLEDLDLEDSEDLEEDEDIEDQELEDPSLEEGEDLDAEDELEEDEDLDPEDSEDLEENEDLDAEDSEDLEENEDLDAEEDVPEEDIDESDEIEDEEEIDEDEDIEDLGDIELTEAATMRIKKCF